MAWNRKLALAATLIGAALASSVLAACGPEASEPVPTVPPTVPIAKAAPPTPAPTRPPAPTPAPAPRPSPTPTAAVGGQDYAVEEGDTLGKISQRFYGDDRQWRRIHDANKAAIGDDPDLIKVGTKLRIPPKPQ